VATYGQLQSIIKDRLNEDYLDSQIASAINSSIDFFEQEHMWFNEGVANIILNTGDPVIPNIPADFNYEVRNGGLQIVDNNNHFPLRRINNVEYDSINNQSSGRPYVYVQKNNQILLYSFPDQNYPLELYYVKTYADLVNESDTNDWTVNAARLIEAKTIEDIWLNQRKDIERWRFFMAKTAEEFKRIQRQNKQRIITNKLIVEDLVNNNDSRFAGIASNYF
jgi:hypothetical protein